MWLYTRYLWTNKTNWRSELYDRGIVRPSSAYSEFFDSLNSVSSFLTCEHRSFNNITVLYIIRDVHQENGIASWLQLEIWKDIFRAWGVSREGIGSEGYSLNWPHWVQALLSGRLGHVALQPSVFQHKHRRFGRWMPSNSLHFLCWSPISSTSEMFEEHRAGCNYHPQFSRSPLVTPGTKTHQRQFNNPSNKQVINKLVAIKDYASLL